MDRRRRPSPIARVAWGFAAALIGLSLTAVPASSAKEDVQEIGRMPVRYPPNVFKGASNGSLIVNSALRRGYQFFYREQQGITLGRVVDLDTFDVLVQRVMPASAFPTGPLAPSTPQLAGEWIHVIDPDTHTLFVGTSDTSVGSFAGIAKLDPFTLEVMDFYPDEAFKYEPDTDVDPTDPRLPCLANSCLPQPPTATPQLRGLAFADPFLTGLNNGKLLLLMQENSAPPPLESNINVAYVAQWDAETGNQDWIERVQSCGTSTFPGRDAGLFGLGIFQSNSGGSIYVTCQASGGTGQVVRIPVDGNNRPLTPNSEQAFPGPQSLVDAIADPGSDRMLMRVQNEDGDSWWVFDGASSSYSGVIGATLSRVTAVAAGIDRTSGRLYMLAPPTNKDAQSSEGGLMLSDIRRSPAPQFLSFEDFSGQWEGAIQVDVHPTTGVRRLFALRKEADHYTILRDGVPISADVLVQDRDRLTIDVEEEEGVTGRTFTGAGHAYGLRVLMAGGLEAFPPTGPDLGGFRVGRYVPFMVGSPCGSDLREVVIGSVDQANLSNNLTSAGASVGNSDAATGTDIGEPTARCYPRPRDPEGTDLWSRQLPTGRTLEGLLGDYPTPHRTELDDQETGTHESKTDLDELAGSDWPFTPTQCSENADDATRTRLRPLDRGDDETGPIPDEHRRTEVPADGARASVDCDLRAARVFATAEILSHAEDVPAVEADVPQLGQIRIGEVSAMTLLYLDGERGLVARSVSIVRGISLGDHVSIDAAVGIGEAWAAGRPGTAGTSYERFLCGVRVKDQAPDTHVYRPNPQVAPIPTEDPTSVDPTTLVDPNLQGGAEIQKAVSKSTCGDPNEPALNVLKTTAGIDDKQPLIDIINRALGTRGRVSAPKPDGQLAQGTPGGYLASVQKDRLNEISSRAVNADQSTQVPALELLVFNDDRNQGRGRQLYQFAGVDASVTYGIFLLNPAEFFEPGCAPFCVEDRIDRIAPPLPIGPQPVYTPPPPRQGPLKIMFEGMNFLLRSPKDALLAAAVWGLLYAPVQLAGRRRALRRLA